MSLIIHRDFFEVDGNDSDTVRYYKNTVANTAIPVRLKTYSIHKRFSGGVAIYSDEVISEHSGTKQIVHDLSINTIRNIAELLGYRLVELEE